VTFSRAIAYPKELLLNYDPNFVENVPKLSPTENELAQIQ